jgi:hypothetical protein
VRATETGRFLSTGEAGFSRSDKALIAVSV